MIRVNLLGAREPVAPTVFEGVGPTAAPSGGGGKLLLPVLIVGAFLAFSGWRFIQATNDLRRLDGEISELNQEKVKLQAIINRVNEFQKKLEELEKREALIERLKREREGPVRMLDQLSAHLPDFVWLTGLNQSESGVAINGMAASYVSIADYIQKLEASDLFRDVELIDARQDKTEFTSFQLRTQLESMTVEPVTPPPADEAVEDVTETPGQPTESQ